MQKYLIYQTQDLEVKRKPVTNLDKAEAVVKLSKTKTIKIDNEVVHIVGIGTDQDFRAHKSVTGQSDFEDLPHFVKLKANVKYLKDYGKWPESS